MKQKLQKIKNYVQFLIILAAILVTVYLFVVRGLSIREILSYAERNHLKIFLALMGLYILKGCCGIVPYSALNIAAAVSFPLLQAILINTLGTIVCFCISYAFGRMTRTDRLEAKLSEYPKLARYMSGAKKNEWVLCFALHIAGFSSEVIGILFGILRMKFALYLGAAMLGVLPGMICITISGGTKDITSAKFWIFFALNALMALVGLAVLWIRVRGQKKHAEAVEKGGTES